MAGGPADVIRELFDAISRRDLDAALAVCDPDGEFWPSGTAERTGRTAPYRGHAGVREYFADLTEVWEEFVLEPGELRVAADAVVSFGTVHVRARDEDERATIPVIWVFKLRAGKVLSARVVPTAAEAHSVLAEQRSTAE